MEKVEQSQKNDNTHKTKIAYFHPVGILTADLFLSVSQVAVHSFVENLFKSIWGLTHGRAPHAIKYFFDFLDAQAADMKILDPEVLHIWKTNRYGCVDGQEETHSTPGGV